MEKERLEIYTIQNKIVNEAYEFIKTNINLIKEGKRVKSIALLSFYPNEGKTTMAINLSIKFAQSGIRVLLIDTDLRKAIRKKQFCEHKGISNIIAGTAEINDVIVPTYIDNLEYIYSGDKFISLSQISVSNGLKEVLETVSINYDLIFLDTPALTSVIDGSIIASMVDGSILIVKSGEIEVSNLKRKMERLKKHNINLLGIILNRVSKFEYKKNFEYYNYFFNKLKIKNNAKHMRIKKVNNDIKNKKKINDSKI